MFIVQRHNQVERLTEAFRNELNLIKDPEVEQELSGKYLTRLTEATTRRDTMMKAVFTIDAILAFAVSGKSIKIPGTDIGMGDIPALMEVLVGLASAAIWVLAMSMTTWLCYSRLYHMFNQRMASKYLVDPDILLLSVDNSEPATKIFRNNLYTWDKDWLAPLGVFRAWIAVHNVLSACFGIGIPALHLAIVTLGVWKIVQDAGFDLLHVIFYLWILVAHLSAITSFVLPLIPFTYRMMSPMAARKEADI